MRNPVSISPCVRGWIKKFFKFVIAPAVTFALLAWAADAMFAVQGNREAFERLLDAPIKTKVIFLGLCIATALFNGLGFWVALSIAPRSMITIQSINAMSTALNALPVPYASKGFRFGAHKVVDKLGADQITAWFFARAALILVVPVPMIVATNITGEVGWAWCLIAIALLVAMNTLCYFSAALVRACVRFFPAFRQPFLRFLPTFSRWFSLSNNGGIVTKPNVGICLRSWLLGKIHKIVFKVIDAVDEFGTILQDKRVLGWNVVLGIADMIVHTLRFVLTCHIVSCSLSFGHSMILAPSYFIGGLVFPVGLREIAVGGVGENLGYNAGTIIMVASTITIVDFVVNLGIGLIGSGLIYGHLRRNNNGGGMDSA
jgi:hypothetical protein